MNRAEWIDEFKEAFGDLDAAARDAMQKRSARTLSRAECRELYDDARGTIDHLLDHPPDDGAPDAADVPPPAAPANPAAAHRRQAKRTLLRFFNLCLPSHASAEVADEIESIVDHIVDAAVLEAQRAEAAARLEATPIPT
jgi:hypothetical protein